MLSTDELLHDLTDPQREAVTTVDGPLLIVAGAGSGKTRVITRRVAYLMSLGLEPSSILAITFTNKAAGEMKSRVSALCDRPIRDFGKLDQPWPIVCTFHSLCLRILRHYAPEIGLPTNFSIFDSADQTKLIKDAIKAADLSTTNFPASSVHAAISNAKNRLESAEVFSRKANSFGDRQIAKIYTNYQKLLKTNNALDFDDLLLRTAEAFRDHANVLRELQDRFTYILIDEYQDTNHAQYIIAHSLALRHKNICVVGDPDQSIYAWRGADIKNILEFERDYPDAKVVRLEQNYRSTKIILDIADRLIAHNTQRKEKKLWTENDEGEKATLILCQDEHDEADQVTKALQHLHEKENFSWNQMAIFYRMNALSRVMEDALRRANVPYQIARGVEFYNRKEIKDVLAYLRVVANPDDEVSLTRIINVPARGIGDTTVSQLKTHGIGMGLTLWGALKQAHGLTSVSTRALNSIKSFVSLVERWRSLSSGATGSDDLLAQQKGNVQRIVEDVVTRSGIDALLKKSADPDLPELANVNELISSAAEFDLENPEGSLNDYLSMISLVSDADHLKDAGGAVTMMTLHAAKGLEFPVVAMIGLEEGILPHSRARDSADEREEERRLCFVGITRAQKKLLLTKAHYRTIRGLRDRTITSPFLTEMPQERFDITDRTELPVHDNRPEQRQRGLSEADRLVRIFPPGKLVRHPQFGLGRIAEISSTGVRTRAVVDFNASGRKVLILQATMLEPA